MGYALTPRAPERAPGTPATGTEHDTAFVTYRCFLPDLTRFVTVCCVATGRVDPGALAGTLGMGGVCSPATVGCLLVHLPSLPYSIGSFFQGERLPCARGNLPWVDL
jgi:hypothetical protein